MRFQPVENQAKTHHLSLIVHHYPRAVSEPDFDKNAARHKGKHRQRYACNIGGADTRLLIAL